MLPRTVYPQLGGLIFSTHGDLRAWGAQQWWTNLSLYYWGIQEACSQAAAQQWGSTGIYYPETVWFDGLEPLPEDIADEMRELYLCNKPWESVSARFTEYAFTKHPHSSRWNWIGHGKWEDGHWRYGYNAVPPFSPVNHFFASGPEIAFMFWKRYEYTLDADWLREKAYPIIKGVCEFLRNFPNFKKADDGKYHVYHVNQGEHLRGTTDAMDFLLGIQGLFPAAILASEILGLDTNLRDRWREVLGNLASLPTSADEDAVGRPEGLQSEVFLDARQPFVDGRPRPGPDPINARYFDYDLGPLEEGVAEPSDPGRTGIFELAENTFRHGFPTGIPEDYAVRVMSGIAVMAARLGRAEDFRRSVLNQLRVTDPAWDFCDYEGAGSQGALANRMTNREGANAIGAQRLGNAAYALHEALCQSVSGNPGGPPVIRLFPALPDGWDGSFCLACGGGFLVESTRRQNVVLFVSIRSRCGGECRIRNPWPADAVIVKTNDEQPGERDGELFTFSTAPGDELLIYKKGSEPSADDLRINL